MSNATCLATVVRDSLRGETIESAAAPHVALFPYVILVASLPVALAGSKLAKPAAFVCGATAGFVFGLELVQDASAVTPIDECQGALPFAIASGVVGAILALYAFSAAFYLVGALVGGLLVAQIMDSFDLEGLLSDFAGAGSTMMGKTIVPYWVVVALGAILGAIVTRWWKRQILVAATALLGAWGIVLGVKGIAATYSATIPFWVSSIVFFSSAALGAAVQLRMQAHSGARACVPFLRRRRAPAQERAETEMA